MGRRTPVPTEAAGTPQQGRGAIWQPVDVDQCSGGYGTKLAELGAQIKRQARQQADQLPRSDASARCTNANSTALIGTGRS